MNHYSDPKRASEPPALPNVEVWYHDEAEPDSPNAEPSGWYWQACFPGCLPDGEPSGPFATEAEALADAREGGESVTRKSSILDCAPPERGAAADAYAVACTASLLVNHKPLAVAYPGQQDRDAARHACALHRISGQLHRIAERQCNEDLTCPKCKGDGNYIPGLAPYTGQSIACRACAGEGSTMGRKLAKLRKDAAEIASHYGLRVYFQTDPRGCALYLIDPAVIPAALADLDRYTYDSERKAENFPSIERLQSRWIDSNYPTCGHAVVRLGR